jgi:hypothetical protein
LIIREFYPKLTLLVDTALPNAGYQYIIQQLQIGDVLVDFIADDRSARSYFWDFGDGNTATGDSVRHRYTTEGLFNTSLTVGNGCGSDSSSQELGIITPGIDDELPRVSVYPNPNSEGIWRMELGEIPLRTWRLTDVLGRSYPSEILPEGSGTYRLEAVLRAGVYILKIDGLKPVWLVVD